MQHTVGLPLPQATMHRTASRQQALREGGVPTWVGSMSRRRRCTGGRGGGGSRTRS